MDDPIPKIKAAFDQMAAIMRDTFVPAIAEIESLMLAAGASSELAVEFSMEYATRMLNFANFGVVKDE